MQRVRRSVDTQLRAQRSLGHLETVDEGLVGLARTLADAIDYEWALPEPATFTMGALAGKLTTVLLQLRGERRDVGDGYDVELEQLRAAIRDAAGS